MNNKNVFKLIESLENLLSSDVSFSIYENEKLVTMVNKEDFRDTSRKNNSMKETFKKEVKKIYPTNNRIEIYI